MAKKDSKVSRGKAERELLQRQGQPLYQERTSDKGRKFMQRSIPRDLVDWREGSMVGEAGPRRFVNTRTGASKFTSPPVNPMTADTAERKARAKRSAISRRMKKAQEK